MQPQHYININLLERKNTSTKVTIGEKTFNVPQIIVTFNVLYDEWIEEEQKFQITMDATYSTRASAGFDYDSMEQTAETSTVKFEYLWEYDEDFLKEIIFDDFKNAIPL